MITDRLETRQLVTLDADGILVRGTYHDGGHDTLRFTSANKSTGVLFLNPLSTPRTFIGDSAVYWANSFAAHGYPSLRIDMPGLGDSYGAVAKDLVTFINNGGYASLVASKVNEFSQRFGLKGVVIYGHCAGATTAILAASMCDTCKGLIITDPYFNLANMLTPKLSPGMVDWARRTTFGEILRAAYARLREVRKRRGPGKLPRNANVKLVTQWKQLVSRGLPILVFKSGEPLAFGSATLRSGAFDYLGHISSLAGPTSQLSLQTIEGTNHSFADALGRTAIRQHATAWLKRYFPIQSETPVVERIFCEVDS